MWTRKELKDKAKASLKSNYWKVVLVASLALITGSTSVGGSAVFRPAASSEAEYSYTTSETDLTSINWDELSEEEVDQLINEEVGVADVVNEMQVMDEEDNIDELPQAVMSMMEDDQEMAIGAGIAAMLLVRIMMLLLVVLALVLALAFLVLNPLKVGTSRFFIKNLNQPAEVKEVAYAFDNNYRETVKTMLWRDIYTFLWALLLVVPGIIKMYEYRMIPYLLADDPTMTKDQAFAESKRMMTGNKWKAFVLDLSFLGWLILSAFTFGLLFLFYVSPYRCLTMAALYESLRYDTPLSAEEKIDSPVGELPIPSFAQETNDAPEAPAAQEDAPTFEAPEAPAAQEGDFAPDTPEA